MSSMAHSTIKLIYFKGQAGRAEASRLLLAAAGKAYEEVDVTLAQWAEMKAATPCGHLPVIEIDGRRFGQSRAIATYLAREFGLYGKDALDGLKIDQTAQVAEDFVLEFAKHFYYEKDPDKKAEGVEYLKKQAAPKYLGYFENFLKDEGTGHVAGSELTLGDIVVFDVCTSFLKAFVEDSLGQFPLVQALLTKVESNERIKEYLSRKKVS